MRRIDHALARLDAATGSLANAHDCAIDRGIDQSRIDESRISALEADNKRLRAAVVEAMGQINGLIGQVGDHAGATDASDRAAGDQASGSATA